MKDQKITDGQPLTQEKGLTDKQFAIREGAIFVPIAESGAIKVFVDGTVTVTYKLKNPTNDLRVGEIADVDFGGSAYGVFEKSTTGNFSEGRISNLIISTTPTLILVASEKGTKEINAVTNAIKRESPQPLI